MASIKENLLGSEGQSRAFSRFGPQFQGQNDEIIRNLLTRLGGQTQQGFEPIENQARQDFQQKTIPSIAERFTTLGNGAISSPAYQAQQYGAGAQFETGLQALKSQYGMQQNNQLMQLLQLLSPQQAYFPGQPGALEGGAKGIAESLPAYLSAQRLGNQLNPQSEQQDQSNEPWNWQNGLDTGGNALLAAAPLAAFIPGFGPILSAALGLVGGGLKIGGKYAPNSKQGQNFDSQQTDLQKQLMNLGITPQQIQMDLGKTNNSIPQNNSYFGGLSAQSSPYGKLDFNQKSPGLNRIGSLA